MRTGVNPLLVSASQTVAGTTVASALSQSFPFPVLRSKEVFATPAMRSTERFTLRTQPSQTTPRTSNTMFGCAVVCVTDICLLASPVAQAPIGTTINPAATNANAFTMPISFSLDSKPVCILLNLQVTDNPIWVRRADHWHFHPEPHALACAN